MRNRFNRILSMLLCLVLFLSLALGQVGVFSSVAAEGTPPFVASTKAVISGTGVFLQSYIGIEKGVSSQVSFYGAETLDVYGYESTMGGEVLDVKKSERETSMGAADLENYYTTWTTDPASVPYQAYEVDVSDVTGIITFGFVGKIDSDEGTLVMQVYNPAEGVYFNVGEQSYYNGDITLTYTVDAQLYAENGRVRYRITFPEGSTDKWIYMKDASAGYLNKDIQYGTTKTKTSSSNNSYMYRGEYNEDMIFMSEVVNENGVACSLPTRFIVRDESNQQEKLVHFNVNFAGDAKTTRNMTWSTAENMATVVQVIPYGPLFPDFSGAREYVGETVDYTEEYKNKYVYNFAHYVTVDGLEPGGEYWYRYGNGEDVWSAPCYLRTDDGDGKFSFFFGGDPQPEASGASEEEEAEMHGNIYNQVALSWNEAVRLSGAEFFVNAGDETDSARYERDWNWYYKMGIPVFRSQTLVSTMGNHDCRYDSWADTWNFPYWLKKHHYVDPLGEYEHGWFYSFDYGNAHFTVINGNIAEANGSALGVDFGELRDKMLAWMEADLAAASDADFKIVLSHQGMYSYPVHTYDDETEELRELIVPLLDKYDVDLFLQGHDHIWMRTNHMEKGKKVTNSDVCILNIDGKRVRYTVDPEGTVYTNSGSITGSKYHNPDPYRYTDLISVGLASQPKLPTFTTVEIENGKLTLKGWAREEDGSCKRISEYEKYGSLTDESLCIIKTSFYDDVVERINALPEALTLENAEEVKALKGICDIENERVISTYITNYSKLEAAVAVIEELERKSVAPEITVNGEFATEWETGKPFEVPTATAYDEYEGEVEVILTVTKGEESIEVVDGICNFATPGTYTFTYTAIDADENKVEKVFTVEVVLGAKRGDLDGDGNISVSDALAALRIAARLVEATEADMLVGDLDGDGSISVSDALSILRVAAKLVDEL